MPHLRVLASDVLFSSFLQLAGWEFLHFFNHFFIVVSHFFNLFLCQQIIYSRKGGLLLFILNNLGRSDFFHIHCWSEGQLFNPR